MRVHEPFRNVRHPYLPAVAQLRTAPQSSDQNFENPFNKALQVCLLRLWVLVTSHSFQHANQVRPRNRFVSSVVISWTPSMRQSKGERLLNLRSTCVNQIAFRYRYDGLYTVEKVRIISRPRRPCDFLAVSRRGARRVRGAS
jgi:hypothetical protein